MTSAASARPVVGVQVLLVDHELGAVLLGKRQNTFGAGSWALPGGHLEFGESFEDAAARELKEETNISASELRTFMPLNTPYETTHYVQIGVEVLRHHGELRNMEPDKCSDLRYFQLSDLPEPLFEPSRPFLEHALDRRMGALTPTQQLIVHLQSEEAEVNRHRFVSIYLVGDARCGVTIAYGRMGESRPRQVRQHPFESLRPALEYVATELDRRIRHGYWIVGLSGTLSLDEFKRLFPKNGRMHLTWIVGSTESVPAIQWHDQPTLPFDEPESTS